jgi:hypothetical protein
MMKRRILQMARAKRIFLTVTWLVGSLSLAYAGALVTEFRAEPGFNKVTLKWHTEAEKNLKGFDIERGLNNQQFEKIGSVDAKPGVGKKDYLYEDNTVFKTTGRIYYYRLKIVEKDGDGQSNYSQVISVAPTISSARQTWGSIKAMFR